MEKTTKRVKVGIHLIKMLKALDNHIRLLIVEHMLNSAGPISKTYIHKIVEETRGKTSKETIAYHLDILLQSAVLKKIQHFDGIVYHVAPEAVRTLEHHGLIGAEG